MNGLLKVLNLSFIPSSADLGLLFLRAALGGGMLALHGWKKLELLLGWGEWARPKAGTTMEALTRLRYSEIGKFPDPLKISGTYSLVLTTFAEAVCSALLIIGFCTRFAATGLLFGMGVAFFIVHEGALSGKGSGELAAVYLIGFFALFIAGPGRYSFDGSGGADAE